jgi:uncharacterized protein YxeA
MKKIILQIGLMLVILLVIIIAIRLIKSINQGTPNQQQKGNPLKPPAQKKSLQIR